MNRLVIALHILAIVANSLQGADEPADLLLHNGRIVTVDETFSIQQAIAIRGDRVLQVGTNDAILRRRGATTTMVDLQGKTVLPGLIDSHVHATGASIYEFDHEIPVMANIDDVLKYVASRAAVLPEGTWIRVSQVFITRLEDQRFPTRSELDQVAPRHPVYFRTGPDAALNSLALELNGIDKDYELPSGLTAKIERDPSGEPTGIIRSAGTFIKTSSKAREPTEHDRLMQLRRLIADYNAVGITSVSDRNASDSGVSLYRTLRADNQLHCRVYLYYSVNAADTMPQIQARIQKAANHELHERDNRLWLRGVKLFLDGGMLTGSAFMQRPWGVSTIYGISDPEYRGVRYIEPEKLYQICRLALSNDLQITAHSVGDGAVQTLVDVYAEIDRTDFPIRDHRPCVTHCNFLTDDAIDTMAKLGIVADLQPAWLWLDGRTLRKQFGDARMRLFQPYKTLFARNVVVGGGSDHMQRIGSMRSVNPYNPFLGMWIAIQRTPRGSQTPLHRDERLTREQAIRLYTINNAFLTFEETEKGSLEAGKLADLIVLDRDLLSCEEAMIPQTQVLKTYVGGQLVHDVDATDD